ncbi:19961_t:CDS:2 [Rhizophagus irregularis]|nr:19961_t:CDS:2 [Rhizophagus irregularis]
MISEVTIHQTYKYIESNQIQAVYKFPILNSSTICNFEAKIDDERKIKGIVKEVDQATKEYEEAIKEGNVALTIDDQLPDVFQCFIGTISSGQTIEIKLTYVSELRQNTESEGIRFILPTAIAQKYNYYSLEKNSEVDFENNHLSEFDSENCKIEISVTCRMTEVITSVESPTHSTKSALNVGLDKPRAFVEYNPKTGTNCAMLTLVPQCLPYIGQSEFIFIVDVSLDSQTLSHILKALELALYSLPEDSLFNVISQNSSLFPEKSQKYSQSTFTTALEFVQNISQQNIFNEFNLYSTLESIFNALTNNSTKIFYLTNSYSITKQYEQIKELFHNQKIANENFNFFTLFVGDENSNNDIYNYFDLLTKLGRGYSTFTNFNDKFEKKLISIIKNSLEIPLSNYEINWIEDVGDTELLDYSDEKEIIVLDNEEGYNDKIEESDKVRSQLDESTYLAPNLSHDNNNQRPKILQAPSAIPLIYNKHNAIVYALLTKGIKPSKTLHIKAQSQQGLVQFNVPLDSHVIKGKIIHTLAAKKFIDFEENNLNNFKGKSVDSDSKVKDKIISLGKTYNLISTYTSFLAINKWSEIFSSKTPSDINNTPISIYHNYKPNNNSFAYFKDFTKRIFSPSYTPSTVSSELCNLSINSNCILSRYTGNFTYFTSNLLTNPVTFIKNGIDEVIDRYSYETLTLGIKHKHPIYYLGNGLVMYGSVVYKIVRKFEQFPVFGGLFVRPVVRFIDESILNNMRSLGRTRLELEELSPEEFDKHFRENIFESHEGMINPIIVHVETLFNFLKLFSFDGKILDEIKFYEFFEKECLLIAISLAYFEIILWKEFKEESIMFYNKSERSLKKMIKIKEGEDLDLDEKYNELLGKARKLINNWFD